MHGHRRLRHRRSRLERLETRSLMAVVSHWTGDNTSLDSAGTNHGTLVSGTGYSAGQVSQAFHFDGVDDRVQVADSASLKLTNSLTIEAWVKADSLTPSGGVILFRGDDRGGLDPYSLSTTQNGALQFQISSLTQGMSVTAPMPVGQFVHVAGTLDDATGEMSLYINGVLTSQTVTTVRPFGDLDPNSNPGIGIGNHGGYPQTPHNFPFKGLIDELKLYNTPLTTEEVLANFNAGKGTLQPAVSISDASVIEGDTRIRYQGNAVEMRSGGLDHPYGLAYGPDGNVYVSTRDHGGILRYDATSGAPLPSPGKPGAEFVSSGAGGLSGAREISFGPDGNLYVVSEFTSAILRFDAVTGEPLGELVSPGSAGLDQPRGLLFHSDGYLYVTSVGTTTPAAGMDSILRFDATTGAPAGLSGLPGDAVFIPSGTAGLDNPSQIIFHNGDFYVSSTAQTATANSVLRFGTDGSSKGAFVTSGSGGLSGPVDLEFQGGYLYVTSWTNNKVLRYDGATGAFVNVIAAAGGLSRPLGMLFEANGNLIVASGDTDEIRRYGVSGDAVFTISLSAPFPTAVSMTYATANGSAVAGSDYVAAAGTITFEPGQTKRTVLIETIDDAVAESDENFSVNLTNPQGGIIADGQGVGTIFETLPTKFYVVDDSSADRTFEYGEDGTAVENYAANGGNTAPRGAASTIAGDKVWVVDANKKVYVYNTSGALLGSWTAGGLGGSAQLEGIATNGTDVWLVDNKADKVFRYANAASRTSGTQNPVSSFTLFNKGPFSPDYNNKNPTDMVTDGTHLWVLNDGVSEDKLFKYTLTGTAVWQNGWTLDPANSQPTGVTLDPANPSDFWIVDAGTDRVYRYAGAVLQAGGGLPHTATESFALAPGNTNPQGIADPPPASSDDNAESDADRFDLALMLMLGEEEAAGAKKRR
jgi:hypothetical protein